MFDNTITLFNFHEPTNMWYPSIISNANLTELTQKNNTASGMRNGDTVEILINCNADKSIQTKDGLKGYTSPKEYNCCNEPDRFITFNPDKDFIYHGEWADSSPISDDNDFDSGFYQSVNADYDGVYKINSVAFLGLIPHFEIGGK